MVEKKYIELPEFCPYCGHEIDYITSPDGIIIAKCSNDNCIGKKTIEKN